MTAPFNTVYVDGGAPITGDGLNTFVQTCDTFDTLRSFIGTDGMQVSVLGKAAAGDGDGGGFYWNATATGPDDDLNVIIPTAASGGGWIRLPLLSGNLAGPLVITDTNTGGLTADGAAITGLSHSGISAQQITAWAFAAGGGSAPTYDGVRGVVESVAGQTVLLANGIAGYVIESTGRSSPYPPFPVAVAVNGIGIADADGAGVWGFNTVLTDNRGQFATTHGPRFLFGAEVDFNVTSPNTGITGLQIAGNALAQPVYAYGVALLGLNNGIGGTLKWSAFHFSGDATTQVFADIGMQALSGNDVSSQNFNFHFTDGAGARKTTTLAASDLGFIVATDGTSTALDFRLQGAGTFRTGDNGGLTINARSALVASAGLVTYAGDVGWTSIAIGNGTAPITLFGVLTVPGVAYLMKTTGALTNGAAAQTATLTNGPVAGNPTKWMKINDGGTDRFVPAW